MFKAINETNEPLISLEILTQGKQPEHLKGNWFDPLFCIFEIVLSGIHVANDEFLNFFIVIARFVYWSD